MHPFKLTPIRCVFALLISIAFVVGCSSSDDSSASLTVDDGSANAATAMPGTDDANIMDEGSSEEAMNDVSSGGESETAASSQDSMGLESNNSDQTDSVAAASDSETTDTDPTSSDSTVPDPLIQNTIRVNFDIEVPAYQSNALQVRLVWGEKAIAASWVGDELIPKKNWLLLFPMTTVASHSVVLNRRSKQVATHRCLIRLALNSSILIVGIVMLME